MSKQRRPSQVQLVEDGLSEIDTVGNGGTIFPYGPAVKFPCDAHRRDYSREDASAVAEMVNQSSWLTRTGR